MKLNDLIRALMEIKNTELRNMDNPDVHVGIVDNFKNLITFKEIQTAENVKINGKSVKIVIWME